MKDKITIPNPLSIWTSQTPWTKRIIIVFGVIVVTAMMTGNFDTLIGIFINEVKK